MLDKQRFFFAGVAGAGMSAIAQYLSGIGKTVAGSDRLFNTGANDAVKQQLQAEHITCYDQLEARVGEGDEVLVVSTAIEEGNVEVAKARSLHIPVITRAQLLAQICESKKTIAIAGTSGKSSTAAMLFHLLSGNGIDASLITGAGIISLIRQGKIGNCHVGKSEWLIIEADESDGSLVNYRPAIGVLLNVDKDHKDLDELHEIFSVFRQHTRQHFVVNRSHHLARTYSGNIQHDFGKGSTTEGTGFRQEGFHISFKVDNEEVNMPVIGEHNMENALACIAVGKLLGVSVKGAATALQSYPGIYRRHQLLGKYQGITVIDDYAHNPAKIAASILACRPVADKLIAWFQPHGYAPTRFIRKELVAEIIMTLRPQDEIWMSEIYYAGGTTTKDISAADLVHDLEQNHIPAFFVPDRKDLVTSMKGHFTDNCVLLLMGARDPSLEQFGEEVMQQIRTLL